MIGGRSRKSAADATSTMSDFTSAFLNEDWGSRATIPRVYLGAFGKHPGWNDHMDDVGLATHSLATLRRILYGSGIAAQIEGGAWENQETGRVLPAFDHIFCWRRPAEMILGQIWTSRDGKGRSLYPMILAAHCVDVPLDAVSRHLLPLLDSVSTACRAAASAGEVIAAIDAGQTEARKHLNAETLQTQNGQSTLGIPAWTHYFERNRPELMRLFYHLVVHFQPFTPSADAGWSTDTSPTRSRQIRLPLLSGTKAGEAFNTWLGFLSTQIDTAAPVFAVMPRHETWMDVVVGEPAPADFFVLRAGPNAVPLVTDIPYQIEPELVQKLQPIFASLQAKELPSASILNGQPVEANQTQSQRWLTRQRPSGRGFFNRFFRAS